ncbi:MAG TPA: ATP synthase F1 subunit delta [Tepidisphaeraceae bacterium]|nr:ATP synthase F1 subunit delta [Tepidisphaeraceae bacterium]
MAKTTPKSSFATAYAASLLELANESKQAEPLGQELRDIAKIIADNRTFGLFLAEPAIGQIERGEVIKKTFASVTPLLRNFMGVLNEHNRLGALGQISESYDELLDEQLGKIEVDVTVPAKLSSEQFEEVRKKVSAALKKDAVVHQYVDESLIGGLVLRVQDKLIDASVKTQLRAMKEQLLTSKKN